MGVVFVVVVGGSMIICDGVWLGAMGGGNGHIPGSVGVKAFQFSILSFFLPFNFADIQRKKAINKF